MTAWGLGPRRDRRDRDRRGDLVRVRPEALTRSPFPDGDFDQRADDVSVDHPSVVEHYREAHAIAVSGPADGSDTEDLRRGMVHDGSLFWELLAPEERSEVG